MIDILVPVLRRPRNIWPLTESIRRATEVDHRILFIATADDLETHTELHRVSADWISIEGGDNEYPRKMNLGFSQSGYPLVLLASDDLDFQPGWDWEVVATYANREVGVIGTNDKANGSVKRGKFSTHSLVRRAYIEEWGGTMTDGPGVIFHEGYDHNFVDRELCAVAQHRGQWAFAQHSVIIHRHPNWKTAPMDSTYEKGLRNFKVDQELFFSRAHLWDYQGLSPAERRRARQLTAR